MVCVDVDLERIEQLSKVLEWAPDIHVSSSTCSLLLLKWQVVVLFLFLPGLLISLAI